MRGVFWFRSDLRLRDNTALSALARRVDELVPVFVLDDHLLRGPRSGGPRSRFLLDSVARLARDLERRGRRLVVRRGRPEREIGRLLRETRAEWLAFNRDYGPYARRRDERVRAVARRAGARVLEGKDRVLFESDELRTRAGGAYAVYTPYRNAWWARLRQDPCAPERAPALPPPVRGLRSLALPGAGELGLDDDRSELPTAGEAAARRRLQRFAEGGFARYPRERDRPAADGTSRLSPYLRFGLISVRECLHTALERARAEPAAAPGARRWIDQLVWRDFYHAILAEHPRVATQSYRREYDAVRWEEDEEGFAAWCAGRTGYPIVDAGMRQLAASGWMHNRVRMIVASFLTKDLLIDWRRGEAFFYQRLVDGDPANNNGGWQWAASTGTDPQPYFRIFNPTAQGERFDPDGEYVRRWVPELRALPDRFVQRPWEAPQPPRGYPEPVVDHAARRVLAVKRFEAARRRRARRSDRMGA